MSIAPAGVQVACITPFNKSGDIDEGGYRALLDRFAAAGVGGVFLCLVGTGEAQIMEEREIRRTWEIGVEQLKGKVPVYACGIGPIDTRRTIALANEAGAIGVDGVYVYAPRPLPAPFPQSREVIQTFLDDFLDAVRYPIHLANNPFIIGYSIPPGMLRQAAMRHPHLASICNADGDVTSVTRMQDALRGITGVYEVMPAQMLTNLFLGGQGPLSIESNVAPRLVRSVLDAFHAGDLSRAGDSFARLLRLNQELSKHTNPVGVKAALNLMGLPGGQARAPYMMPGADALKQLQRLLDELEITRTEA